MWSLKRHLRHINISDVNADPSSFCLLPDHLRRMLSLNRVTVTIRLVFYLITDKPMETNIAFPQHTSEYFSLTRVQSTWIRLAKKEYERTAKTLFIWGYCSTEPSFYPNWGSDGTYDALWDSLQWFTPTLVCTASTNCRIFSACCLMFPDWQALAYTNMATQLLTTVYCHFIFSVDAPVLVTVWWFSSVGVSNGDDHDCIFFADITWELNDKSYKAPDLDWERGYNARAAFLLAGQREAGLEGGWAPILSCYCLTFQQRVKQQTVTFRH